jgi:hypothetical protein
VSRLDRTQLRHDLADANYAGRRAGLSLFAWLAVFLAVIAVIGAVIWGVKVATSDVKGAGDATRITNDGRNRINAQEWFAGQYEQIRSTDQRITVAAEALAADPADEIAKTNYTGLINRCLEMVGNYNAEAVKVSRGKWRDPALPYAIDTTDPATDCRKDA